MKAERWRYRRDHITERALLDEKLAQWGNRGWELASMIHAKATGNTAEEGECAHAGGMDTYFQSTRPLKRKKLEREYV